MNPVKFEKTTYSSKDLIKALKKVKEIDGQLKAPEMAIFLDTNFLISLYDISKNEREKIISYLDNTAGKLMITYHTEKEYLSQREKSLNRKNEKILKISKTYQSLSSAIKQVLEGVGKNRIISNGVPYLKQGMEALTSEIDKVLKEAGMQECFQPEFIKNELGESVGDPILNFVSEKIEVTEKFDDEVYVHLEKAFVKLRGGATACTFPGKGETKKKNMHGDFVIFHEMIAYAKEKTQNIYFITADSVKGDWFSEDQELDTHLLGHFTVETSGQVLKLIHSDILFEDIDFDLFKSESEYSKDELMKIVEAGDAIDELKSSENVNDIQVGIDALTLLGKALKMRPNEVGEILEQFFTHEASLVVPLSRIFTRVKDIINTYEDYIKIPNELYELAQEVALFDQHYSVVQFSYHRMKRMKADSETYIIKNLDRYIEEWELFKAYISDT